MLKKFIWIVDRYEELSVAISQPEIVTDPSAYQRLLKERSDLEPKVIAWQTYQSVLQQILEARELLNEPEFAQEAEAELSLLYAQRDQLEQELKLMLLPTDPNNGRSVILEVRGGTGGEEACLFAADLLRLYERFAQRRGCRTSLLSANETDLGGVKEAVMLISGPAAYSSFKYESGVHRVQRVPVTDTTGKKQTSACTVAVLPEAEEVELEIDPKDLRVDVYRSTGHGGQCINTTDSAVRITHIPTGVVVTCQDQKSQLRNKEQAMRVLRSRLLESSRSAAEQATAQSRKLQVGSGDRSERIRTYNFHEGRVTDHRIGLTLYRIDAIMNGELDEIVDALRIEEQANLLKEINP